MTTDPCNTTSQLDLTLPDGSLLPCRIRISERARTVRLRILPPRGDVELVLPCRADRFAAEQFVRSRLDWILRTRSSLLLQYAGTNDRREDRFPRTLPLRYLGGDFSVEYVFRACSWTAARCEPEARRITVTGNVLDPLRVREALRDMLKRSTGEFLIPHFQGLAEIFSFTPGSCTVRIQKGRWGSCSSRGGAISLNAMLLLLPEEIVEYILIHELCHLRQMNHSDRFWKEVEAHCPDFLKRRRELRKLEKGLTNYFLLNLPNLIKLQQTGIIIESKITCHKQPFFCCISLEKIFFQHNKNFFQFFSKTGLTFAGSPFRIFHFAEKCFQHKFC